MIGDRATPSPMAIVFSLFLFTMHYLNPTQFSSLALMNMSLSKLFTIIPPTELLTNITVLSGPGMTNCVQEELKRC